MASGSEQEVTLSGVASSRELIAGIGDGRRTWSFFHMYYLSSAACNQPNSADPMSPAAIAAQDAYIASVGSHFTTGNQALDDLIAQLGGTIPDDASGDAGVPTVGTGPLVTNASGPGSGDPMGPSGVPWVMQVTPGGTLQPTSSANPGAGPPVGGYSGWRRLKAGRGAQTRLAACKTNPTVVPLVSGLYPGAAYPASPGVSAIAGPGSARRPAAPQMAMTPANRSGVRTIAIPLSLRPGAAPAPTPAPLPATSSVLPPGRVSDATIRREMNQGDYAAWLQALPPNQPESCIMGGIGCKPWPASGVSGFGDTSTLPPSIMWAGIGLLGFGFWMIFGDHSQHPRRR